MHSINAQFSPIFLIIIGEITKHEKTVIMFILVDYENPWAGYKLLMIFYNDKNAENKSRNPADIADKLLYARIVDIVPPFFKQLFILSFSN